MTGWGTGAQPRGRSWVGACTRVHCFEVEAKVKGGQKDEQTQAQAGVNELLDPTSTMEPL